MFPAHQGSEPFGYLGDGPVFNSSRLELNPARSRVLGATEVQHVVGMVPRGWVLWPVRAAQAASIRE